MTSREVTVKAAPGSPEWLQLITASKIPSILGISRFKSQFSLWHEMAGNVETEPISKAQQDDFDYGHAAELAAAEYWRFKNPAGSSRAVKCSTPTTHSSSATLPRSTAEHHVSVAPHCRDQDSS